MRWAPLAAAVTVVACAPEPNLPLPAVEGAVVYVVLVTSSEGLRAEVLAPDGALHLEVEGRTIEALAFTRALGVPLGPLVSPPDGEPLPTAAGSFVADVDALRWTPSTPSPAALELRVPRGADDCPTYTTRTARLSDTEPAGVHAVVRIDGSTRLAVAPNQWFVITQEEVEPMTPILTEVHALTREPEVPAGGAFVLARGNQLWSAPAGDLTTATATLARVLPPGLEPFSIAAPALGVVYGLTTAGVLFRSDSSTTTVVHRFRANQVGTRGVVATDGRGIVAGVGSDQTLVRIDEDGVKTTAALPSSSDGVVSVVRFGELGLVVGTNNGRLLAERLGFEPIPDPLGQMPLGVALRALRPLGDRLLFGGNSGVFGEVSARGFVCVSSTPASSTVRFIEPMADQILALGLPIEAQASQIYLTRFFDPR